MLSRYTLDRKSAKRWQTLADQWQRILKEQQITTESPGAILRDVATLIEFVGSGGIVPKGRNANLPIGCLPELNCRTSYPIQPGLKRALLRDYPNLAGTFILLRVIPPRACAINMPPLTGLTTLSGVACPCNRPAAAPAVAVGGYKSAGS